MSGRVWREPSADGAEGWEVALASCRGCRRLVCWMTVDGIVGYASDPPVFWVARFWTEVPTDAFDALKTQSFRSRYSPRHRCAAEPGGPADEDGGDDAG